jgi:HD-GYP domain-containing protein (c-di-GMP phosphodiesterase class II)
MGEGAGHPGGVEGLAGGQTADRTDGCLNGAGKRIPVRTVLRQKTHRGGVQPPGPPSENDSMLPENPADVPVPAVLSALSFALDLAEGQPMGHSQRTCLIARAIADKAGLAERERNDLYFAVLLKDVGCSGNAAQVYEAFGSDDLESKRRFKTVDWTSLANAARYALGRVKPGRDWFRRVGRLALAARDGHDLTRSIIEIRCARGARIVNELGFPKPCADAVAALDEHWDGSGQPQGLAGHGIPMLARIMNLSQTIEVFAAEAGTSAALRVAVERSGRWFDPEFVEVALTLDGEIDIIRSLEHDTLEATVRRHAPADYVRSPTTFDAVARSFAEVIDAKSPFTARHSARMADIAVDIARQLGYDAASCARLHQAGLLHDVGKLSVPNSILDKPGRLTSDEWEVMRRHPFYTQKILERIPGLSHLAFVASSHHERMDGKGYHRGLTADQFPEEARILAVADVFEALTADRPYRPSLPLEKVIDIMETDRGNGFDPMCLDALLESVSRVPERKAA